MCEALVDACWVRTYSFAEKWFEKMKKAVMSIEKSTEITMFDKG